MLLYPQRLINKNTGLPHREKLQERNRLLIKIPDIAFQVRNLGKLLHLLPQFFHLRPDPVGLLRLERLLQLPGKGLRFLLNFPKPFLLLLPGKHHFRRRINIHISQLLHTALAEQVKAADGLHFLPPQLDTVWIFLRQIKNINDPAPDGKLPRRVHLIIFFISHLRQAAGETALVQPAVAVNMDDRRRDFLQRHLGGHQRRKGGEHRQRLPLNNFTQRLHPIRHQLVPMDIRLVKNQILRRIQGHIPVIKLIILINFPRLQITESNDDFIPETIAESIRHMKLLGIHTSGKADTGPLLFQKRLTLFKFRQFP